MIDFADGCFCPIKLVRFSVIKKYQNGICKSCYLMIMQRAIFISTYSTGFEDYA